jgi:hypothetical protein
VLKQGCNNIVSFPEFLCKHVVAASHSFFVYMQVFVYPRNHRISHGHLKLSLPRRAIDASYENSTRMLVLMFAEPSGEEAVLGFYCFDNEFKKLIKQVEIRVPAVVKFSEHNTLESQMPCVLLPSSVSSDAAAATKVSRPSSHASAFTASLQCAALLLHARNEILQ